MWPTLGQIDFLHSLHSQIQTIVVSDTLHVNANRIDFKMSMCSWSERLKVNVRRNVMYFRKSRVCSKRMICKKWTAVSHSTSVEAEIVSLDADLRLEGIPVRNVSDMVFDVLEFVIGRNVMINIKNTKDEIMTGQENNRQYWLCYSERKVPVSRYSVAPTKTMIRRSRWWSKKTEVRPWHTSLGLTAWIWTDRLIEQACILEYKWHTL